MDITEALTLSLSQHDRDAARDLRLPKPKRADIGTIQLPIEIEKALTGQVF
jgi:hypothetical protein